MKNNIDYYQHYINSSDHPKFKMLRVKYGWAGEGKFWALNNKIGEAENCEMDLSKKYNKASIANDLDFTLEEFDEFLEYLAEECNLIIKKNNCITTETIRENLLKVMKERKRNKESYENRKIKDVNEVSTQIQPVETEIQPVEKIQSKVKESKVKESKEKKSIKEKIIKKKKKVFIPPTIQEIKDYIATRNSSVNAKKFFDFYNVADWFDSKGTKVRNWKQKLIQWEEHSPNQAQGVQYGRSKGSVGEDKYKGIGTEIND